MTTTRNATRDRALSRARIYYESGCFERDLARCVACATPSQARRDGGIGLRAYFDDVLCPALMPIGFECVVHENPVAGAGPLLVANRNEGAGLPCVLVYGHGDTVAGMEQSWSEGLHPFRLTRRGKRLYGRGTADNKSQHWINLTALRLVLEEKGALGFNVILLVETGEEQGSPGLDRFCGENCDLLAADVLIASDGPRLAPGRPTLFTGARGAIDFEIEAACRGAAHHSGNWGGLLRDPAIRLVQALATITDERGQIRIPEWRPTSLTPRVRALLADCAPYLETPDNALSGAETEGQPSIDPDWGEAGLTPAERVFGWNSFAVLALECGDPATPASAIAGRARAVCQLRTVVGTDEADVLPALQRHLRSAGFDDIAVRPRADGEPMAATRLDPDSPWIEFATASIERSVGKKAAVLPNLGGSLPNNCFSETLGLPTVWVPHSYRGCNQHAPDEHILAPMAAEALQIMTGLFFDLDPWPVARS